MTYGFVVGRPTFAGIAKSSRVGFPILRHDEKLEIIKFGIKQWIEKEGGKWNQRPDGQGQAEI